MRKFLPFALLTAFAFLPGCVLAVGNGPDEEDMEYLADLEERVTVLEHRLGGCSAACCNDDEDDDEEDADDAELKPAKPAGAR